MRILDVQQGSKEWIEARRGIPTASEFKKIITPAKGEYSADAELFAADLLAESVGVYRRELGDEIENIRRGHQLEGEARRWLKFHKGWVARTVGFCLSDCGRYGYSPDGILEDGRVLEVKSPNVNTMIRWKLKGGVPRDHLAQIHGGMVVTGATGAVFLAYSEHPAIGNMIVEVEADDYTKKLKDCLDRFCDRLDEIRREILGDEYAVYFPNVKGESQSPAKKTMNTPKTDDGTPLKSTYLFCAYCRERIKPGQPTVPDEWGDPGARMHLVCSIEDLDGQDLDRDMGDS